MLGLLLLLDSLLLLLLLEYNHVDAGVQASLEENGENEEKGDGSFDADDHDRNPLRREQFTRVRCMD